MDQKRWLIVAAVILCMTFTLAFLKKIYQPRPQSSGSVTQAAVVAPVTVARRIVKKGKAPAKLDIDAMYRGFRLSGELHKESFMPESLAEEKKFFKIMKTRKITKK